MNAAKKKDIIKAVDKMLGIVEKCGGPGSGIPGPCPSGASGKPGGGGGSEGKPADAGGAKKAVKKIQLAIDDDDEVVSFLQNSFPGVRGKIPKGAQKFATIVDAGHGDARWKTNINLYSGKGKSGKEYTGYYEKNEGEFYHGTMSQKAVMDQLGKLKEGQIKSGLLQSKYHKDD